MLKSKRVSTFVLANQGINLKINSSTANQLDRNNSALTEPLKNRNSKKGVRRPGTAQKV